MTRVAPSMLKPSLREWRNYNAGPSASALEVAVALEDFASRTAAGARSATRYLGRQPRRRRKGGMSNATLFSTVAREYANFRPGYPPELFAWLAQAAPAR